MKGTATAVAVALVAALLSPSPSFAQADETERSWEGVDALLLLMANRGLHFDTNEREWTSPGREPTQQIILVLGSTAFLFGHEVFRNQALHDFVAQGGALLFASDIPDAGGILDGFHVSIANRRVRASHGEELVEVSPFGQRYLDHPDCPLVHRVTVGHPAFREATPIATNRPSALVWSTPRPRLRVQARFDRTCNPPRAIFIVGDRYPSPDSPGIAYLIADHSVFINQMITRKRNARFATNLIDELIAPPPTVPSARPRTHVLVLYDGVVQAPGAPALPPPPDPPPLSPRPGEMVAALNHFLGWLQDERILQEFVSTRSTFEGSRSRLLVTTIVTLVTPLILLGLLAIAFRPPTRPWTHPPEIERKPGAHTTPLEARIGEILGKGKFSDALAVEARRRLHRLGLGPKALRATRSELDRAGQRDLDLFLRWAGPTPPRRSISPRRYRKTLDAFHRIGETLSES